MSVTLAADIVNCIYPVVLSAASVIPTVIISPVDIPSVDDPPTVIACALAVVPAFEIDC